MSDIFAPLRDPEPVPLLAPEEVRRGGDRLRRRRAGFVVAGAVCATALVVGGTALVIGERTSSDSPGPVNPPPRGVIPAEFDLADGLPRNDLGADAPPLVICGEPFALADHAIATESFGHAEQGDFTIRALSVYPDAGTARSVASDLVDTFEQCPLFTDGQGRNWTTSVRPTAYGDTGRMLARADEGRSPEVIQVVRVGASLLVIHERELHMELQDLTRSTAVEVEGLLHRQMCLLTDEGCAWRSDPDVLRPDGWGQLRLGMSREDLEAMGIAGFSDAGACTAVALEPGEGLLAESDELVSLRVPEGVTTPDAIGIGSSRDEVLEEYWWADQGGDVLLVRASPTADYEFTLDRGEVTQLTLTTGEECGG